MDKWCPTSAYSNLRIPPMNIDPNLHQKQGVNHLNKVLGYAPLVAEDGTAEVYLTPEDWGVVADTLFHMDTPREMVPAVILEYSKREGETIIDLETSDLKIELKPI